VQNVLFAGSQARAVQRGAVRGTVVNESPAVRSTTYFGVLTGYFREWQNEPPLIAGAWFTADGKNLSFAEVQ
jgi:hypothetical protein